MKLLELNESMASSAIDQLINNSNKMSVLYLDTLPAMVKNMYAEGAHEDMWRTVSKVVGQQKGRWFSENFLSTSSRRNTPTAGMKNALLTLAKDKRFASIKDQIKELGGLEIHMDPGIRQVKEASFGKHMTLLEEALPPLLNILASKAPPESQDRLKVAALRLGNAVNGFKSLWNNLHKRWDEEWGKEAESREQREAKQREKTITQQTAGIQNTQADAIINQVLGSLDKKVAHDIRMTLSRSDNKLQTVQQELTKRGIKV